MRKYLPNVQIVDGLPLAPTADQLLPPTLLFHVPDPVAPVLLAFGRKYVALFTNAELFCKVMSIFIFCFHL